MLVAGELKGSELYDKKIKEKNTLEMREKTKVSTSSLAGGKMAHLDRHQDLWIMQLLKARDFAFGSSNNDNRGQAIPIR